MATNQKLQIPVYTYEFMPVEKPQNTLFESKEDIEKRIEELTRFKLDILQNVCLEHTRQEIGSTELQTD